MNRISGMNDVHEAALAAHYAGLSVLPIALDGTKRPTPTRHIQNRLALLTTVRARHHLRGSLGWT
jgi:uncharacterized membrane protein